MIPAVDPQRKGNEDRVEGEEDSEAEEEGLLLGCGPTHLAHPARLETNVVGAKLPLLCTLSFRQSDMKGSAFRSFLSNFT